MDKNIDPRTVEAKEARGEKEWKAVQVAKDKAKKKKQYNGGWLLIKPAPLGKQK